MQAESQTWNNINLISHFNFPNSYSAQKLSYFNICFWCYIIFVLMSCGIRILKNFDLMWRSLITSISHWDWWNRPLKLLPWLLIRIWRLGYLACFGFKIAEPETKKTPELQLCIINRRTIMMSEGQMRITMKRQETRCNCNSKIGESKACVANVHYAIYIQLFDLLLF